MRLVYLKLLYVSKAIYQLPQNHSLAWIEMLKSLRYTPAVVLTAAIVFSAPQVKAATISNVTTADGTEFSLTTVQGSLNSLRSVLESQPWLSGSGINAFELAELSFPDFGAVNLQMGQFDPVGEGSSDVGPLFATILFSNGFDYQAWESDNTAIGGVQGEEEFVFAIVQENQTATAVPTPAALPGLLGMGLATLRKRKQTHSEQA